jgi:hypothetical protein
MTRATDTSEADLPGLAPGAPPVPGAPGGPPWTGAPVPVWSTNRYGVPEMGYMPQGPEVTALNRYGEPQQGIQPLMRPLGAGHGFAFSGGPEIPAFGDLAPPVQTGFDRNGPTFGPGPSSGSGAVPPWPVTSWPAPSRPAVNTGDDFERKIQILLETGKWPER